jgi:hypothetical protein
MAPDTSADDVVYDDVHVIADSGLALRCSIDGREVWVGTLQMQPGSTPTGVGACGRLVLKRWMLAGLGLPAPGR